MPALLVRRRLLRPGRRFFLWRAFHWMWHGPAWRPIVIVVAAILLYLLISQVVIKIIRNRT